jgi:transcriptional regulator with XRE-family HTH domain
MAVVTRRDRIGDLVRRTRQERGLTIEDLAREANLTPTTISMCERHATAPTGITVQRLARGLRLNVGELMACQLPDRSRRP